MTLLLLFAEFFKIGLFTVGGGLATLPFIYDLADKYGWVSRQAIIDMVAISESTPGAFGVNMATFTGFHLAGAAGALVATIGLALPSLVIILIIARMLAAFREQQVVQSVFSCLRPVSIALVSVAVFGIFKVTLWNPGAAEWYFRVRPVEGLLVAAFFFLIYKFKKHPVIYIAAAGVLGAVLKLGTV